MKRINLNSLVDIKLTEMGENILRTKFEDTIKSAPFLKDLKFESVYTIKNGILTTTLWEVMRLFGSYLDMGRLDYPIKDLAIYVKDNDIEPVK